MMPFCNYLIVSAVQITHAAARRAVGNSALAVTPVCQIVISPIQVLPAVVQTVQQSLSIQ
jgi:hypothetical protein